MSLGDDADGLGEPWIREKRDWLAHQQPGTDEVVGRGVPEHRMFLALGRGSVEDSRFTSRAWGNPQSDIVQAHLPLQHPEADAACERRIGGMETF